MNKSIKGIVIAAGTIVTVLLMEFLRLPPPIEQYLSGGTIAYAVIATLALNFGAVAGGVIGFLGVLIVNVPYEFDAWVIPYILLACLYGFIIGKIFENKSTNHIGNLALFSAVTAGIRVLTSIIGNTISNIRAMGHINDIFYNLQRQALSIIISSLLIGLIAFLLAFIWYKCSIIIIPLWSASAVKRRAARIAHEKTLSFEQRLSLLNKRADNELSVIKSEIKTTTNAYITCRNYYDSEEPENVLESYKSTDKNKIGFKGGLKALFGGGKDVINDAKEQYEYLINVHNYFEAALDMSLARAKESDAKYRIAREKAILYGEQIIKITEKIPLKDREAFSNMGSLQTNALQINWQNAAKKLALAEKGYNKADKQASKNFDKWTNAYSKRLDRKGTITKWDALEAGLMLVGKGIGNVTRAGEQVKKIGEEKLKIYEAIKGLSESRIDADAFIARIEELDKSLLKSMDAWEKVFSDVYNELFPAGDDSKTQEQREKREAKGGAYFSDNEIQRLMELAQVLKYMMEIVDAEI